MTSINPWKGLHVSNLFTYLSLLCGVSGLAIFLKTGQNSALGAGLAGSFVFDVFDGKFAKSFENRSSFVTSLGSHLDSLADFGVFGVVPAIGFTWLHHAEGYILIFAAAFFFLLCSLTRLAVFQVASVGQSVFIGLPTTLTGLGLSAYLLFPTSIALSASALILLAVLMVSPFHLPRPGPRGLIAIALVSVALFILHLGKLIQNA